MQDYMSHSISLAKLGVGYTSPNPAVGVVIVKEGAIVGQGYTQPAGAPHAEVMALRQAGEAARGAVMYVTLEPCCHYGHTPPCTRAVIEAGIAEVHLAMIDPNPLVCGKGLRELEGAGIKTFVGDKEEEAREINRAFVKFVTTGLPYVIAKFAMSLDGKIATTRGDSRWISGEASRRYAHGLRHSVDAIMVGINTVLKDDPQLTARCGGRDSGGISKKQPLKVIVDSKGKTPPEANIFRHGTNLIATSQPLDPAREKALISAGAEILPVPGPGGLVDLKALMEKLGSREISSIMVEGGGTLLGSLFDQGLVDEVFAFVAPIIVGGTEARTPVEGKGADMVSSAVHLKHVKVECLDTDVLVSGVVDRKP